MFTDVDLQLNMGFKSENTVFIDISFHLKSGFKKILCSQILVFTLILVSQKYWVNQFFLYSMFETLLKLQYVTNGYSSLSSEESKGKISVSGVENVPTI